MPRVTVVNSRLSAPTYTVDVICLSNYVTSFVDGPAPPLAVTSQSAAMFCAWELRLIVSHCDCGTAFGAGNDLAPIMWKCWCM